MQRDGLAMEPMPQPRKRGRPGGQGPAAVAVDALPALVEVPSWPLEFTSTGLVGPGIAVPVTPARNAAVCCARGADPDPARLARDAGVGDVDVVRAACEVPAGA